MLHPTLRAAPNRPFRRPSVAAAAILAACAGAAAQPDSQRPVLPRVDREAEPVMPTRARTPQPVRPGLTGGEEWGEGIALRPTALPEGTFLLERPGRLIDAPRGRKVFVPTAEDVRAGEGPMLVLPSAALERLELALTEAGPEPLVRVSGEIFVYHGRSHLLLTSAQPGHAEPVAPSDDPAAEPPADAEPGPADETPPESVLDDPDVRALLEELDAAAPAAPSPGAPPPAPAAPDAAGPPVADGTPIVRRRGRLVRTGEGAWSFVFDNDTDDALAARPMVVLPCLLLERMERRALTDGDAYELVLSGRVHTHRGEPYLLPTMLLRVPVTGVVPMQ